MFYAGSGRSVVSGNLSPRLHQLQHSTIAHGSVVFEILCAESAL
jgi:hypothetical protein